ncbi:unnamed protein product [Discosporangium mesarthrocarpum]
MEMYHSNPSAGSFATLRGGYKDAQGEAARWNDKGNRYLGFKDYLTASSCFEMALRTDPESPKEGLYLANLATAQFRLGLYERAARGFARAIDLAPTVNINYICLGKVFLRWEGHEQQAVDTLQKAVEIEPTPTALSLAAKANLALRRTVAVTEAGDSLDALADQQSASDLELPVQAKAPSPVIHAQGSKCANTKKQRKRVTWIDQVEEAMEKANSPSRDRRLLLFCDARGEECKEDVEVREELKPASAHPSPPALRKLEKTEVVASAGGRTKIPPTKKRKSAVQEGKRASTHIMEVLGWFRLHGMCRKDEGRGGWRRVQRSGVARGRSARVKGVIRERSRDQLFIC